MQRRIAIVEKEKCHPLKCPGTYYCIKVCPINRMGKECITKDIDGKIKIDETLSTDACSICVKACPFGAIHIIRLPEKLNEDPVHRYNKNSFELFRLPKIKKGTVVGIIGRNGIGKSTALSILSGALIPNFGNFKEKPKPEDVIEKFKKTPYYDYFSDLYSSKIKISYKPQRIELLPEIYKGKVIDLINKVDEAKTGTEILKELDLWNLKDRNINELSGGELQRLAVAASLIKDSDVYYFDEPSSFLDVNMRTKVAKLIRNIKNKAVMVVEHDLTTLDYVSDEIQIIYGEQACYGVISQSKGVSRGINEYLDGFLPDDNVRFRDYKIIFSKPVEGFKHPDHILFSFNEFDKSYENFKLHVNAAELKKSEVLGVVGANGLGKTTFLKVLAGIEKPDKGSIEKVKIAYKTQYPKAAEGTAEEYLKAIAGSEFNSGWYQHSILEKLNLKGILKNELSVLSGGELQKVYIASTLSTDSQILAFDEPSAFIDVEDRLKVAEVIKDFVFKKSVSAIVVDHDIQFIDYLADRMLVFEGIPGVHGNVYGPCSKQEGMNKVLKNLKITYRKDSKTNRARINKPDSQLDKEQKESNKYYME